MFSIEINEQLTKDEKKFLKSKKHLRNMNAFFREEVGIKKPPHPEVDNFFERLRTNIYLKYPQYPWISRLYKSRKRKKNMLK